MLKLTVGAEEYFDEETEEFSTSGGFELELEHSLVALSKWESRTNKAFLAKEGRTAEEILLYVDCMILNPVFPPGVTSQMTQENIDAVRAYIDSPQSATKFGDMPETKGPGETITSELIYYWMVAFNIPFETELWHLNRLFSLIRICNLKNSPPKKMSQKDLMARNRTLNAERRKRLGTRG